MIFFHTNGNGDVVFFDELGAPWDKHVCLVSEARRQRSITEEAGAWQHILMVASLRRRPDTIQPQRLFLRSTMLGFMSEAQEMVGQTLTGVVAAVSEDRTEYVEKPGEPGRRRIQIRMVDLFMKSEITLVLAVPVQHEVAVGNILRVVVDLAQFESRAVLSAAAIKVLQPE